MRAAIILAAGRSRRFGTANKLLSRYRGRPLLRWAIDAALGAQVGRVLVVIGADRIRAAKVVHAVRNGRVSAVFAPNHRRGHRASLLHGLRSLRASEGEALVFLGDMPLADHGLATRLVRAARGAGIAVRATHRGIPGHPVLIRDVKTVADRLIRDESPFRNGEVLRVESGPEAIRDIDRPGERFFRVGVRPR
ncbi:NTP transferase domain-containing protein [Parasphingopyxis algicola]|uniref:nucleotidyltransferase family protein n=1 Tax=Parasphingopyxis algicola TaxID=2026624 RepID=UPI0015A4632C|nr:NTP transferase domain-containing protein [Parasphingopyxis algicola]QLC24082.1 NTP transferase domain-containing protein [Parasphingopyxis algicola]